MSFDPRQPARRFGAIEAFLIGTALFGACLALTALATHAYT